MSLDITELDTVSYPSWWATSSTVRIRGGPLGALTIIYEGATSDVEFLPQGISFPYSVYPWTQVTVVEGTS